MRKSRFNSYDDFVRQCDNLEDCIIRPIDNAYSVRDNCVRLENEWTVCTVTKIVTIIKLNGEWVTSDTIIDPSQQLWFLAHCKSFWGGSERDMIVVREDGNDLEVLLLTETHYNETCYHVNRISGKTHRLTTLDDVLLRKAISVFVNNLTNRGSQNVEEAALQVA